MTCKGICARYSASKPVNAGRYESGQKRCQVCEIYLEWEGRSCPCCGYNLRNGPRKRLWKTLLREKKERGKK